MLFDEKQFKSRLTKVFDKNGFSSMLNMERVEKFTELTEIMLEENEKYRIIDCGIKALLGEAFDE